MTLPTYGQTLRNLAAFLDTCTALQRLEFVGKLEGAQSSRALKDYVASKFFFQRPHIVDVIEDAF